MYRLVVVVAVALLLSTAGALGLVRSSPEPPAAPAPGGYAEFSAANSADLTGYIASLQDRLRRLPTDHQSWAQLGLAYVEQARVTGNPTFYTQADQAIDRSFELRPKQNADAFAAAAAVSAARHDFEASLAEATRALRLDPYHPSALPVRVDALTELGRYRQQLQALEVADRRQPGVPVAARYAYALELRGRLAEASSVLARAATGASRTDRAYLLTLLADLERRRGLLDRSGGHLREALRLSPEHVPARASSARLAVARGRLRDAVVQWKRVTETLPLPEYVVELGELYDFMGREDDAQQQYDVVDATNRLLTSNGVNSDLEAALINADHGDSTAALTSARAEWSRRESIHVADALAWALHMSGQDQKALRLARAATRLGTLEPRFWLHRGAIEAALGKEREARRHLRAGLSMDPGTSPWQVARARAWLAELEDLR